MPKVVISKAQYDELLRDQAILRAMEAAGVDNWEGMEHVDWSDVAKLENDDA